MGTNDRPTMHDVAAAAGVSLKTVSRVVNAEAGVRSDTASRVWAAIQALGYRRNDLAAGLRSGGRTALVGLVIGDLANPFYAAIARSVEQRADVGKSVLITGSSDEEPEREEQVIGRLLARQPDGLLVVPATGSQRYLAEDVRRGLNVVFLDRPPHGLVADTVLFDNAGGARAAVAHLASQGYERIAMVGERPSLYTARERLKGYQEGLAAAGLPYDDSLVRLGPHDAAAAATATAELLTRATPPDAIFTENNRMTVGALHAIRDTHRPVGLLGFDDFELADLLGITVVTGDPARMGREAANVLFDRIGGHTGEFRTITLPTKVIVRGTGERGPQPPTKEGSGVRSS